MDKRKRVGIITFHSAINFGAILQTYALYKTVSQTYVTEIIDYNDSVINNRYRLFNKGLSFGGRVKEILLLPSTIIQRRKFNIFRNKMRLSSKVDDNSICKLKYDIVIAGSDQVWNYTLTNNNAIYLLNWVNHSSKKFSYAASIGVEDIEAVKGTYVELLRDFSEISVRESYAKKILYKQNILSEVNIDPVFLIGKEQWEKQVKNPNLNMKYVLIYSIGHSESLVIFAKEYGKRKNAKVIYISDSVIKSSGMKIARGIGPEEWLGLFANAECIFTNSFHGTAFSIIFNKDFFVEDIMTNLKNTNSRLENLLNLFRVNNRKIGSLYEDINWDEVNDTIALEREKAINYLCNMQKY